MKPFAAAFGFACTLAIAAAPPTDGKPDVARFAELPVLHEGRVKPLETVARSALLVLRGKQSISDHGRGVRPAEWLLDVTARPELADRYPSIRVDDPELLSALGVGDATGRYCSFSQLAPGIRALEPLALQARALEPSERDRVQAEALDLYDRLILYDRLKGMELFRPLPPAAGAGSDDWSGLLDGIRDAHAGKERPGLLTFLEMLKAWRNQDGESFNRSLAEHAALIRTAAPLAARKARWEAVFQRAQPFIVAMALYLIAGLLVAASWLLKRKGPERAASAALAGAVAVHTAGLVARMWLEGRPPVTNLYSSAVFVGWVGGLLGLWQEGRAGGGLAAAAASVLGFSTLIIAQHLCVQGDTMEMMRAVLDSNFWLATHVVTITVGYGTAFLAGALANIFLVRGVWTRSLGKEDAKRLVQMTYFAVCLGLFFSFVGTVLGGIWADQSWGRFWGWDPKENGALLIVLWLALVLHARWGGFVREPGLMAMAVFGNVVTALSWFGVNMLGVGLHSYGFTQGTAWWLAAFIALQLAVMSLAAVRPERWRSAGVFADEPLL